jgi:hypothetical protein
METLSLAEVKANFSQSGSKIYTLNAGGATP